ncbi:ATP-dependent 26S proteasome regulatory subunit [Plantibacter flavus]|uniref:AAA family ATPase n=1 Tax=Plantibacter flavus TaxID=150123 RepID=UPI0010C184F9|nr:AAA family ATPase [Plantibacter flavus]TKJ98513.1 ATP-dependent 26S proteasome regulatory subunit [Plantibacter flavus]
MNDTSPVIDILGTLVRIASVDIANGSIHFRLPDGRTGRSTGHTNLEILHRGDVVILGAEHWETAPQDVWPEPNSVSVVTRVLDDGSVLIEGGISIKVIQNDTGEEIQAGNTVEYNEIDGVVRVVSETPLRAGGHGESIDIDDVRRDYLWKGENLGEGFSDFGGYPDVKERARELIETQLERRDKLNEIKARPVKGVLFTGPPGTGKTHLARIIARESKADFYLVSGPSIISKWLGDTEDTLRKIFEAATMSESGRAIIFFDEIDSIAERRSGDSHESSRRLVAQFLTLMDGFDDKGKSVIVIAATNRADALDPALTRPGRFDWEIEFGLPDLSDRLEILQVRSRQLTTRGVLPLEDVALLTEGWSAADLTAIWTEAALVAASDDRSAISPEDVAAALDRVASKPRRSSLTGVSS